MGCKVKKVLVTGSKGFIGKNLLEALSKRKEIIVYSVDVDDDSRVLTSALKEVDIIYHLAGVNRPEKEEDFIQGNIGSTQAILSILSDINKTPSIIMSSSTQAGLNNPYGLSKKKAEDLLFGYSEKTGSSVYVYRLTNVFGKWCRPNYNSVVATFCHNIANGLDITLSDRAKEVQLVYIDDVVKNFLNYLTDYPMGASHEYLTVSPVYNISLGDLADKIYEFRDIRTSLVIPDLSDNFTKCLYATYISYLPIDKFSYALDQRVDQRGELAELLKSLHFGQIFVSRTRPGITRGNHYHHTKVEKFVVLEGEAIIRFRSIKPEVSGQKSEVIEYTVFGKEFKVVDIPPGYTHSIENIGANDLIVLFWADEVFDFSSPDTFFMPVLQEKES